MGIHDYEIENVWPSLIYPPHEVRDAAKLAVLTEAMRRDGWTGRPLLVLLDGETRCALTGSHRLPAAIAADLDEVPVVYVDGNSIVDGGDHDGETLTEAVCFTDQDWMPELLDAAGCADAAALMREEIAANDAESAVGEMSSRRPGLPGGGGA